MLQAYLSQLILKYAKLYIQNIEADLQLSLWGGDVVLNNLELRLSVLQDELSIPIGLELTRGFIKEFDFSVNCGNFKPLVLNICLHRLRIHVPWTALTSRSVEITLSGIELTVTRRPFATASHRPMDVIMKDDSQPEISAQEKENLRRAASAEADADEGWLQSLITRIAANVSVFLKDIKIKYVQDDVAASVEIESLNVISTNESYSPFFSLLSGPWKLLHKQLLISRFVVTVESISRAAVPGPPGRLPSRPAPLRQYMAENDHTLYGVMQSQALGAMPGAFSLNGGHVSSSDQMLLIPNVEVRLKLYLQPLMSNFRPVSRKKLLTASAGSHLSACGSAVVVDVMLVHPIEMSISHEQIQLCGNIAASLGGISAQNPVASSDHVSAAGSKQVALTSSIWTSDQQLEMGGVSSAAASGKRRGMTSWLWRTFVEDEDATNMSLQDSAHAQQLEGFAPTDQIAACLHISGLVVSLKKPSRLEQAPSSDKHRYHNHQTRQSSMAFARLDLMDIRVEVVQQKQPFEALTATASIGLLALSEVFSHDPAAAPSMSHVATPALPTFNPILLAGDKKVVRSFGRFLDQLEFQPQALPSSADRISPQFNMGFCLHQFQSEVSADVSPFLSLRHNASTMPMSKAAAFERSVEPVPRTSLPPPRPIAQPVVHSHVPSLPVRPMQAQNAPVPLMPPAPQRNFPPLHSRSLAPTVVSTAPKPTAEVNVESSSTDLAVASILLILELHSQRATQLLLDLASFLPVPAQPAVFQSTSSTTPAVSNPTDPPKSKATVRFRVQQLCIALRLMDADSLWTLPSLLPQHPVQSQFPNPSPHLSYGSSKSRTNGSNSLCLVLSDFECTLEMADKLKSLEQPVALFPRTANSVAVVPSAAPRQSLLGKAFSFVKKPFKAVQQIRSRMQSKGVVDPVTPVSRTSAVSVFEDENVRPSLSRHLSSASRTVAVELRIGQFQSICLTLMHVNKADLLQRASTLQAPPKSVDMDVTPQRNPRGVFGARLPMPPPLSIPSAQPTPSVSHAHRALEAELFSASLRKLGTFSVLLASSIGQVSSTEQSECNTIVKSLGLPIVPTSQSWMLLEGADVCCQAMMGKPDESSILQSVLLLMCSHDNAMLVNAQKLEFKLQSHMLKLTLVLANSLKMAAAHLLNQEFQPLNLAALSGHRPGAVNSALSHIDFDSQVCLNVNDILFMFHGVDQHSGRANFSFQIEKLSVDIERRSDSQDAKHAPKSVFVLPRHHVPAAPSEVNAAVPHAISVNIGASDSILTLLLDPRPCSKREEHFAATIDQWHVQVPKNSVELSFQLGEAAAAWDDALNDWVSGLSACSDVFAAANGNAAVAPVEISAPSADAFEFPFQALEMMSVFNLLYQAITLDLVLSSIALNFPLDQIKHDLRAPHSFGAYVDTGHRSKFSRGLESEQLINQVSSPIFVQLPAISLHSSSTDEIQMQLTGLHIASMSASLTSRVDILSPWSAELSLRRRATNRMEISFLTKAFNINLTLIQAHTLALIMDLLQSHHTPQTLVSQRLLDRTPKSGTPSASDDTFSDQRLNTHRHSEAHSHSKSHVAAPQPHVAVVTNQPSFLNSISFSVRCVVAPITIRLFPTCIQNDELNTRNNTYSFYEIKFDGISADASFATKMLLKQVQVVVGSFEAQYLSNIRDGVKHPSHRLISFESSQFGLEIHNENQNSEDSSWILFAGRVGSLSINAHLLLISNLMNFAKICVHPSIFRGVRPKHTQSSTRSVSHPQSSAISNADTHQMSDVQSTLFSPQTRVVCCLTVGSFTCALSDSIGKHIVAAGFNSITFHSHPMRSALAPPRPEQLRSIEKIYESMRQRCFSNQHRSHRAVPSASCSACSALFDPSFAFAESAFTSVCSLTLDLRISGIKLSAGEWTSQQSSIGMNVTSICEPVSFHLSTTLHSDAPDAPWSEVDVSLNITPIQFSLNSGHMAAVLSCQSSIELFLIQFQSNAPTLSVSSKPLEHASSPAVESEFLFATVTELRCHAGISSISASIGNTASLQSVKVGVHNIGADYHQRSGTLQVNLFLEALAFAVTHPSRCFDLMYNSNSLANCASSGHIAWNSDESALIRRIGADKKNLVQVMASKSPLPSSSKESGSRDQILVTVEISAFRLWFPLDVVAMILNLCDIALNASKSALSTSDEAQTGLFWLSTPLHEFESKFKFLVGVANAHAPLVTRSVDSPKIGSQVAAVMSKPQSDYWNSSVSSALVVADEKLTHLTARVILDSFQIILFERCSDLGLEDEFKFPGHKSFDAVSISVEQVFVLQAPFNRDVISSNQSHSNTISKGTFFQTQQRTEISVVGLQLRAFDQLSKFPVDSCQVLKPTSVRVEQKSVIRHFESASRSTSKCMFSSMDISVDVEDPIYVAVTPRVLAWSIRFSDRLLSTLPATVPPVLNDAEAIVQQQKERFVSDLPDTNLFVDDLRSMQIDRVGLIHPKVGHISFSDTTASKATSTSRWLTWHYVAPRSITHIHVGSIALLMQSLIGEQNRKQQSSPQLVLSAWNSSKSTYVPVFRSDLFSNSSVSDASKTSSQTPASSPKVFQMTDRVFSEKWKLEWTFGILSALPSAEELGQLLQVDSMFHPLFIPSISLNANIAAISLSVHDTLEDQGGSGRLPHVLNDILIFDLSSVECRMCQWPSLVSSAESLMALTVSVDSAFVQVVDFRDLCMVPLINPFRLQVDLTLLPLFAISFASPVLSFDESISSGSGKVAKSADEFQQISVQDQADDNITRSWSVVPLRQASKFSMPNSGRGRVALPASFQLSDQHAGMDVSLDVSCINVCLNSATVSTCVYLADAMTRPPLPSEDQSPHQLQVPASHLDAVPLSRYFVENKTGLSLELEQVGSNEVVTLGTQLGSDFQSFLWIDSRTVSQLKIDSSSGLNVAEILIPALGMLRKVCLRGRGSFLWSPQFDIEMPGLHVVKVAVDLNHSLSDALRSVYSDFNAPIVSCYIWVHVQIVGINKFITFLPSHCIHNNFGRSLAVGLSMTGKSEICQIGTLPIGQALPLPCLFPDDLPISISAASSQSIAINGIHRQQSRDLIVSLDLEGQDGSSSSWAGAFPIKLDHTSLLHSSDEAWIAQIKNNLTDSGMHYVWCHLSCPVSNYGGGSMVTSPASSARHGPVFLSCRTPLIFVNNTAQTIRFFIVSCSVYSSEQLSNDAICHELLTRGTTVAPNATFSCSDHNPDQPAWILMSVSSLFGDSWSLPFVLQLSDIFNLPAAGLSISARNSELQCLNVNLANQHSWGLPTSLQQLDTSAIRNQSHFGFDAMSYSSNLKGLMQSSTPTSPTVVVSISTPMVIQNVSDVSVWLRARHLSRPEPTVIPCPRWTIAAPTLQSALWSVDDSIINLAVNHGSLGSDTVWSPDDVSLRTQPGLQNDLHEWSFRSNLDETNMSWTRLVSDRQTCLVDQIAKLQNSSHSADNVCTVVSSESAAPKTALVKIKSRYVFHNRCPGSLRLWLGTRSLSDAELDVSKSECFDPIGLETGSVMPVSRWPLPASAADFSQLGCTFRVSMESEAAADRWSVSAAILIPDESARQHIPIYDQVRTCERLISFVVLRHRMVSHVVFFKDPQPPRLVVNTSPHLISFQEASLNQAVSTAGAASVHVLASGSLSEIAPDFEKHAEAPVVVDGSDVAMEHAITQAVQPASSDWSQEEEIFASTSRVHAMRFRLASADGWSESIQLVENTVCSISLLDEHGHACPILVEIAERRGTVIVCVASPKFFIPRLALPVAWAITSQNIRLRFEALSLELTDDSVASVPVDCINSTARVPMVGDSHAKTVAILENWHKAHSIARTGGLPLAHISISDISAAIRRTPAAESPRERQSPLLAISPSSLLQVHLTVKSLQVDNLFEANDAPVALAFLSDSESHTSAIDFSVELFASEVPLLRSVLASYVRASLPPRKNSLVLSDESDAVPGTDPLNLHAAALQWPQLHSAFGAVHDLQNDVDLVHVSLKLAPVFVDVEDRFALKLATTAANIAEVAAHIPSAKRHVSLVHMLADLPCSFPPPASTADLPKDVSLGVDQDFMALVDSVCASRVNIHRLEVGEVQLCARVSAAIGGAFHVGAQRLQLKFKRLELDRVLAAPDRLSKEIVATYLTDAILRSPLLLGSLDLLGSPTLLLERVGAGFHDLVAMPAEAAAAGGGVGEVSMAVGAGVTSLFQHIASGSLSSLGTFSGSLARNLTVLGSLGSGDARHLMGEEQSAERGPRAAGLKRGARALSRSLVSAAAGLITSPVQQLRRRLTVWALVKGMGQGLLGAVAKPLGGALSLVANTANVLAAAVSQHSVDPIDALRPSLWRERIVIVPIDWSARIKEQHKHACAIRDSSVLSAIDSVSALDEIHFHSALWVQPGGHLVPVVITLSRDFLCILVKVVTAMPAFGAGPGSSTSDPINWSLPQWSSFCFDSSSPNSMHSFLNTVCFPVARSDTQLAIKHGDELSVSIMRGGASVQLSFRLLQDFSHALGCSSRWRFETERTQFLKAISPKARTNL